MKRLEWIRHLERHVCELLRERARHSIEVNPDKGMCSTVPRRRDLSDYLARKICRDLDVPDL